MPADHVWEWPFGRSHELAAGHDRELDRMSRADAAGCLVSIGDAIEFDPDFACRNALNRQFDVEKAERGIIIRALCVEIERAYHPVLARPQFVVPRHLRLGPRRRPRRQRAQRTELPIRITLSHASPPDCCRFVTSRCRAYIEEGARFRKRAAFAAKLSRLISRACSAN